MLYLNQSIDQKPAFPLQIHHLSYSLLLLTAKNKPYQSHHCQKYNTMNTTTTNTTSSKCPDFLESPPNTTDAHFCALGSCGNNTAVMHMCCNGADVVPYYYDSGFPGAHNETSGYATWCHMDNEAATDAWSSCISGHHGGAGMCWISHDKNSAGRLEREVSGVMGLVGLVLLLHALF